MSKSLRSRIRCLFLGHEIVWCGTVFQWSGFRNGWAPEGKCRHCGKRNWHSSASETRAMKRTLRILAWAALALSIGAALYFVAWPLLKRDLSYLINPPRVSDSPIGENR